MALTGFSWHSKFKLSNGAATHTDQTANRKLCSINIYSMVGLVCILFIIGCTFIATDHTEKIPRWGSISSIQTTASNKCQKQCMPPGSEALPRGIVTRTSDLEMQPLYGLPERKQNPRWGSISSIQTTASNKCQKQCMPPGSEALPRGIVTRTSDLEMQPLYGTPKRKTNSGTLKSLLAIAVGIKQKESVDQIVTKFISNEFNVMLFHYDGVVDEWRDLPWCNGALHVSASNQTKWWFAKRFLHPDIVAEYSYIFLWDEDLGVENFDPRRYLSIIQEEGLEISQPALDIAKGPNFHHRITARQRRNKVHRRYYQFTGGLRCYENSTGPPCTGWVEMMAPVFSRAAWHCAWYMIQNDLVHSWGLDFKLGYCAQGERTKKVGIVDAEYIVHKAIPSLGGFDLYKVSSGLSSGNNGRLKVRTRSYAELDIFKQRWKNAVEEDECWTDLYPEIN